MFYIFIPMLIYLGYVIWRGCKDSDRADIFNIVGMVIVILASINDYAFAKNWIQSVNLALPAVGVYVVIHVFLMSREHAEKVFETEALNESLTQLNATLDEKVNRRTEQLQKANELLAKQALYDSLTGINNRRRFNEYIRQQFLNAVENHSPLSIILFDLDEFKKYNDYYGHIPGDQLLQKIVTIVREQLPNNSLFARYGGEEFVIVLPYMALTEAYALAETIRNTIVQEKIPHYPRDCGIATTSVGVASMTSTFTYKTEIELIDAADQQLYRSKRAGRNTTSTHEITHSQH